jgi:Tol biopolymer transport system component
MLLEMHRRAYLLLWMAIVSFELESSLIKAADLRAAIYVVHRDGTGLRKVAQVDGHNEHSMPRWSHDGKRLAFSAEEIASGSKKIFVVDADGKHLEQIGAHASPDWSPDDKQIAYRNNSLQNREWGIYVQNLDGNGRVRIADGHAPRWSPDGSRIAFTDRSNLKLLDLVAGDTRDLLDEAVQEVLPGADWSPDGKRLAVVVRRNNARELLIVSVDQSGPPQSRLKRNLDGCVSWSQDGKRLAISAGRLLHVLDPDGKGTQMLPAQKGDSVEPAWSPDGNWIAFSGNHLAAEQSVAPAK